MRTDYELLSDRIYAIGHITSAIRESERHGTLTDEGVNSEVTMILLDLLGECAERTKELYDKACEAGAKV
ncbi:hypothetical protein [Sulfuricurvum sp.]|uniref:hypothetical protein n=1 Tax=Sulfuricurvum sp. TaxID=2025608 RepID=UPI002615FC60|nr:hypothetical protein [Sulfuricurvum sp.]MDD2267624.1 hypothetical protein [Sulfuricurvum sp.]MDD2783460.1 hypothetical protein [Sulfuricurvum sp.]